MIATPCHGRVLAAASVATRQFASCSRVIHVVRQKPELYEFAV